MEADYFKLLTERLPASPTFGALVNVSASILSEHDLYYGHGTTNAADEAYALVFDLFDLSFDQDKQDWQKSVGESEIQDMAGALVQRINSRIPVPYITGRAWFAGLPFQIDDRALIPRSPLAELVEAGFSPWLRAGQDAEILDLCCGGGCIGIASAVYMPEAQVDLADISNCALILAQRNIDQYELGDRVKAVESDLFERLTDRRYDVIVTNPPYVPASSMRALPKEYAHEPALALEADIDGMQIVDRILKESANYLKDDGILVVEVGEIQATVDQRYPELPLTWLDFDRGGEGVFLLQKDDLMPPASG